METIEPCRGQKRTRTAMAPGAVRADSQGRGTRINGFNEGSV